MDADGRVTLPAETLKKMGWQSGQRLHLSIVDNSLLIEVAPTKMKRPRR